MLSPFDGGIGSPHDDAGTEIVCDELGVVVRFVAFETSELSPLLAYSSCVRMRPSFYPAH